MAHQRMNSSSFCVVYPAFASPYFLSVLNHILISTLVRSQVFVVCPKHVIEALEGFSKFFAKNLEKHSRASITCFGHNNNMFCTELIAGYPLQEFNCTNGQKHIIATRAGWYAYKSFLVVDIFSHSLLGRGNLCHTDTFLYCLQISFFI